MGGMAAVYPCRDTILERNVAIKILPNGQEQRRIHDELKGQVPLALVVTKLGVEIEHYQLEQEIIKLVRQQIGAVASLRNVIIVNRLPKTRSGKILRKLMRSITDGEEFQIPSTIDDESIVEEIIVSLTKYKIGIYNI